MTCSWHRCVTLFTEDLPWLTERDKERITERALRAWLDWHPAGRARDGGMMRARERTMRDPARFAATTAEGQAPPRERELPDASPEEPTVLFGGR
jgi:hypothetical protein